MNKQHWLAANISALSKSLLLLVLSLSNAFAYDTKNWMAEIDDSTKLAQMAIPGTHDSGAIDLQANLGETQDWSIVQQLNTGIRFFDIRLANNSSSSDFEVRHGVLSLGSFNSVVMAPFNSFLAAHPNETILMSIKDEDTLDSARLESDYIYASGSKFYQSPIVGTTTLGTVRGKIVVFNRYNGNSTHGIQWGSSQVNIQDEYNLDTECTEVPTTPWTTQNVCGVFVGLDYPQKNAAVMAHFQAAESAYNNAEFWVNFTSANYNGLYIGNNAAWVNPRVRDYIAPKLTPVGSIVVMDYPNRSSGVINSIIQNSVNAHKSNAVQITMIPAGIYGSLETDGHFGGWGNTAMCPEGKYVYGYRLRSESNQSSGDDTALNDIELRCAAKGSTSYSTIYSKYASWGTWSGHSYCSGTNNPVTGFDMKIETNQGSSDDDTSANDVDLYCQQGGYISASINTSWGSWTSAYHCPSGQAVVGIVTRVEDVQGDGDDSALNGVRLLCSAY